GQGACVCPPAKSIHTGRRHEGQDSLMVATSTARFAGAPAGGREQGEGKVKVRAAPHPILRSPGWFWALTGGVWVRPSPFAPLPQSLKCDVPGRVGARCPARAT